LSKHLTRIATPDNRDEVTSSEPRFRKPLEWDGRRWITNEHPMTVSNAFKMTDLLNRKSVQSNIDVSSLK